MDIETEIAFNIWFSVVVAAITLVVVTLAL
jgi:hypothetical protein